MKVSIEISARHVHLSKPDLEILFGKGFELSKFKDLSQPGQFETKETVKLVGPRKELDGVRILGPCRAQTQVEVSKTEARALGLNPPVRDSDNLDHTPGVKIIGPKGQVDLASGVILALRHIHIDPATAAELGVKNYDRVKVDTIGLRDLLFENVLIRIDPCSRLAMHIDTDEANAAGIDKDNHKGEIIVNNILSKK
ncbi:phosphate propanoyltransferase [Patescibacteria group bacterium]|nr:phosphate propanoyltransferase [Patescibacteria group bacterium]MBU1663694.1 phosphate propanoyltransferase [Patescibacteria group bacterium]MBU2233346.1 phosphate propanoyltransferase [Patescibacteria group bacterium]MBU2264163.1 phosphate propanoyltransferase [Patescibacteria group bacterium]